MKIPLRYPTLVGTAMVAAAFSVVVGLLMAIDFAERGKYELFDAPQYLALKQQLKARPHDAELQQAIRELDLQLRDTYFRNRQFMARGMYLLLGGAVVSLLAVRGAVSLRGTTYRPKPVDPEADAESLALRYARWATVSVVTLVAAVLCGFSLYTEPVADEEIKQASAASDVPAPAPRKSPQAPAHPAAPHDTAPTDTAPTDTAPTDTAPTDTAPAEIAAPKTAPQEVSPAPTTPAPADVVPAYAEYLQQWPRFRGPTGAGVSAFQDIAQWNVPDNVGIAWKTPVPLPGPNSPVVWQQRVFLSGATAEEQAVFCFDAATGALQWRHDLTPTKPAGGELEVMEATGYAAPTLATDGVRVYAIFATGDLVAVTLDGQEVWHKNLGIPKNHYGHASSLATHNDLVLIQLDQALEEDGLSRLIALQGATGEVAWEVQRPVPCSWASPIVVEHGGRWMVITSVNPWLIAYSPVDGSELWRADCLGGEVGPSPVCVDGVVYAANEASGLAAVRADGTGDVTQTHILWKTDIDVPDVCTPLVTDKYVLLLAHGVLACFDRASGAPADPSSDAREPLWEEDLLAEVSSSPSQVGNLVYLFSEEGKAWIVEPQADACQRVGEFEMGEPVRTCPAFQPGRIYVRGQDHLFCIGAK